MTPDQRADIELLLSENRWADAAQRISTLPAPEVAELLSEFDAAHGAEFLRTLPDDQAAEVFENLDREVQKRFLEHLNSGDSARLLGSLPPDDITHLLESLHPDEQQKVMDLLDPEDRRLAREALRYPEESVGRLMTPYYAAVRPTWTVRQALDQIRRRGLRPEMISQIYVVDAGARLVDSIDLSHLVLADPDARVNDIIDRNFVALSPNDDREEAIRIFQKFDQAAIPVVDDRGVMLGVVTVDDILDVAQEEATEDVQMQAGVAPLKVAYPAVGISELFRKRVPWLAALLLVYLAASGVVSGFEGTLSAQIVLASFIPLLMGSGGNVGSQSGALTVRALATGELRGKYWLRAVLKELAVGCSLGAVLAAMAFGIGQYRGGMEVGIVVAAAMMAIVITANLFGVLLPLALAGLGIDPAVAASPLITSLTDITSLLIYFSIAAQLLGAA